MQNRLGLRPVPSANGKKERQILLLTGKGIEDEENINVTSRESCFTPYDIQLVQDYHGLKEEQQKRLMAYMEALKKIQSLEEI